MSVWVAILASTRTAPGPASALIHETCQLGNAGKDAGKVKVILSEVPELAHQIQASAKSSCTSAGLIALQAAAVALTAPCTCW